MTGCCCSSVASISWAFRAIVPKRTGDSTAMPAFSLSVTNFRTRSICARASTKLPAKLCSALAGVSYVAALMSGCFVLDAPSSPAVGKGVPGTKAGASALKLDKRDLGGGVASIRETGVACTLAYPSMDSFVALAGVHSTETGGLVLSARFNSKTCFSRSGPGVTGASNEEFCRRGSGEAPAACTV